MEPVNRNASIESLLAHRHFVRAIVRNLTGQDALADDIEQETWLAALRRPPADTTTPRAWLAGVARNLALFIKRSETRRARRDASAVRAEMDISAAEVVERELLRKLIVENVLALDEPYRSTLLLRFYEEMPPRSIAARMGVPIATVRTRTQRGIERLRERLDARSGGRSEWMAATAIVTRSENNILLFSAAKWALSAAAVAVAGLTIYFATRPEPFSISNITTSAGPASAPAEASGANPETAPIPAESNLAAAARETAVDRGPAVRGRVLYEDTGAPCAGAIVSVRSGNDNIDFPQTVEALRRAGKEKLGYDRREQAVRRLGGWKPKWKAVAAADGVFELKIPDDYPESSFRAAAPDAFYVYGDAVPDLESRGNADVTLWVKRAGRLRGIVTNANGRPAGGAEIVLLAMRRDASVFVQRAEAGDDGVFVFDSLCPGAFEIDVRAENDGGAPPRLLQIRAGEIQQIGVALERPIAVAGKVIDDAGAPVEGADVRLNTRNSGRVNAYIDADGGLVRAGRSDKDGSFEALVRAPNRYYIECKKDGYEYKKRGAEVAIEPGAAPAPLLISLTKPVEPPGVLFGKITGIAISRGSSLQVNLTEAAEPRRAPNIRYYSKSVEAADNGNFRFAGVPERTLQLIVLLDGATIAEIKDVRPSEREININIPPLCSVHGFVKNAESGKPIQKYELSVGRITRGENSLGTAFERQKIQKLKPGEFAVANLLPGEYALKVSAKNYENAESPRFMLNSGDTTKEIALELRALKSAGATVSGKIFRRIGEPLRGVHVQYFISNSFTSLPPATWSGGDGSFKFDGVPECDLTITFWHESIGDFSSGELHVDKEKGLSNLEYTYPISGSAGGVLRERDGLPLNGAHLILWPAGSGSIGDAARHAVADANGQFIFENLPPGKAHVQFLEVPPSIPWMREHFLLAIDIVIEDGKRTEINLSKPRPPGATLSGTVADGTAPLVNVTIKCAVETGGKPIAGYCDRDGHYELEGLAPGRYHLEFRVLGRGEGIDGTIYLNSTLDISESTLQTLNLQLPTGSISGKAVRGRDTVVGGVIIVAESLTKQNKNEPATHVQADTRDDGTYQLRGLAAGKYRITARPPRSLGLGAADLGVIDIKENSPATLNCELQTGADLRIRVIDAQGQPVVDASLTAEPSDARVRGMDLWAGEITSDAQGLAVFKSLASGKYTIQVYKEKSKASADVDIPNDTQTTIVLK